MDEMAYALNLDPIEFRLRNYAETDPESNKPYSSKFLKEAYQLGADKIKWNERNRGTALYERRRLADRVWNGYWHIQCMER